MTSPSLDAIEREAEQLLAADSYRSPADRLSWLVQTLIRRWRFTLLIQVAIFLMLRFGPQLGLDDAIHTRTNVFMSDWALWIESAVGIGVFAQTVRDAKILRFLVLMLKVLIHIARHIDELLAADDSILRETHRIVADLHRRP